MQINCGASIDINLALSRISDACIDSMAKAQESIFKAARVKDTIRHLKMVERCNASTGGVPYLNRDMDRQEMYYSELKIQRSIDCDDAMVCLRNDNGNPSRPSLPVPASAVYKEYRLNEKFAEIFIAKVLACEELNQLNVQQSATETLSMVPQNENLKFYRWFAMQRTHDLNWILPAHHSCSRLDTDIAHDNDDTYFYIPPDLVHAFAAKLVSLIAEASNI